MKLKKITKTKLFKQKSVLKSAKGQATTRIFLSIFGAIIGAASNLYIYPQERDIHGLVTFLLNTALFISPFMLMGSNNVSLHFYSQFKTDDRKDHGFLGFLLILYTIGIVLFSVFIYKNFKFISSFFNSNNVNFESFYPLILPLAILTGCSLLIETYLSNFLKVIVPAFLKEFLLKLFLPSLILLKLTGFITINHVVMSLVLFYIVINTILVLYLIFLKRFFLKIDFDFFNKKLIKTIFIYAAFAFIGSFSSQLLGYLDQIMIKAILPAWEFQSIFSVNYFLGNFVSFPQIAFISVFTPILIRHLREKDSESLSKLYLESATLLFVLGSFIFLCIATNLESIYNIMKMGELYSEGYYIVIFVGLARLFDMFTGLNTQILFFSEYFKFNLFLTLLLGILNIGLNYIFIHQYGITGAALSLFISLSIHNTIKLIFIHNKYNIYPFNKKTFLLIIILLACLFPFSLIQLFSNPYLNIFSKCFILTPIFWLLIIKFKISKQVNSSVTSFLKLNK